MKPGGIFRCVVPDIQILAKSYLKEISLNENPIASITFMEDSHLGIENSLKGIKGLVLKSFGRGGHHLWMWDHYSLKKELEDAGFIKIRTCAFNDCEEVLFSKVENKNRFFESVALESRK